MRLDGKKSVCYQCENRCVEPNCHMTCEKYLEEVKQNNRKNAIRLQALKINDAYRDAVRRTTRRKSK